MPQICQFINDYMTYRIALLDEENPNPYNNEITPINNANPNNANLNNLNANVDSNPHNSDPTANFNPSANFELIPHFSSIPNFTSPVEEEMECTCWSNLIDFFSECICCMSVSSLGDSFDESCFSDKSLIFTPGSPDGHGSRQITQEISEEQNLANPDHREISSAEPSSAESSRISESSYTSKPIPIKHTLKFY